MTAHRKPSQNLPKSVAIWILATIWVPVTLAVVAALNGRGAGEVVFIFGLGVLTFRVAGVALLFSLLAIGSLLDLDDE